MHAIQRRLCSELPELSTKEYVVERPFVDCEEFEEFDSKLGVDAALKARLVWHIPTQKLLIS